MQRIISIRKFCFFAFGKDSRKLFDLLSGYVEEAREFERGGVISYSPLSPDELLSAGARPKILVV